MGQGATGAWLVLTDLPPAYLGITWYGLRVWIELGFRALKSVGWQRQHARRIDPHRARRCLVLAVATPWTMAYGTRAEDAAQPNLPPGRLFRPPPHPPRVQPRRVRVFRQGRSCLVRQLLKGHLWQRLWLAPEPWPAVSNQLHLIYHVPIWVPIYIPRSAWTGGRLAGREWLTMG